MRLVAEFATAEDYLAVHEQEIAQGGLLVRGAELPPGTPLGDCTLAIRIRGAEAAHASARLAAATPGVGVMVIFAEKPAALNALAARLAGRNGKRRSASRRRWRWRCRATASCASSFCATRTSSCTRWSSRTRASASRKWSGRPS